LPYRCVFTGGGTGGHIFPALAVLEEFRRRFADSEVLYVGTMGIESRIVPKRGIPFAEIGSVPHDRKKLLSIFPEISSMAGSIRKAGRLIRDFRPDFILGTGGYVSAPSMFAGWLNKIPLFLHEQNAVPGLANRMLNLLARKTFVTYEESVRHLFRQGRVIVTGNPVRREIVTVDRAEAYRFFDFSPEKTTILAFGGSIGAASINKAFASALPSLLNKYKGIQVVFITGEREFAHYSDVLKDEIAKNKCLKLFSFLDKMYYALSIADVTVCRAGATTLAEVTAAGKCTVLVPYPHATDNHQFKNAVALSARRAAFLITDSDLSATGALTENLERLIENGQEVAEVAGNAKKFGILNAAERIVDEITGSLLEGRNKR